MTARRRALSPTAGLLVVATIALLLFASYEAMSVPSASTNTATQISASTSNTSSTGTSTSLTARTGASLGSGPLISYSADAYSIETQALLEGFSASTGISVAPVKGGGSFADANQIAAGAPDDVFVSVSLSATGPTYLKNLSSNWAIGFAADQMVLAYSNATQSNAVAESIVSSGQHAVSTNATGDWNSFFTLLSSGSVKLGISNPVTDPAGLRGWLVLEAAGQLYAGGNQQAYVSSLLKARANVTGTNAATLLASLQAGQIQFLFIYRSAAIANHMEYLPLDRRVNLSDPALAGYYAQFSYTDSAGTSPGSPIMLVITVPLSSLNQAAAFAFVQYVVKNAGTLSSYGLVVFQQARLYHNAAPPQAIQLMLEQGLVAEAGPYH